MGVVMFGFLNKKKNEIKDQYTHTITGYYEGEFILQIEYEETNWDREDPSLKKDYNWHVMLPDGFGKITYKDGDKIIEEYEGEFNCGQYEGEGRLTLKGKIYKGMFENNRLVEDAEISKIYDRE